MKYMKQRSFYTLFGLFCAILVGIQAPLSAQSASTPDEAGVQETAVQETYDIGDTGPAGGIIFYDKGDATNGWRYLEAAPASTELTGVQWAVNSDSQVGGTKTGIGDGKANTQAIVTYSLGTGRSLPAARQCDRLRFGGYDDWFLPSKVELGLMYLNLKEEGLGDFSDEWYWSSSEDNANNAWIQRFRDGYQWSRDPNNQYYNNKQLKFSIRAIRAF
jgi:hypothetical protein